MNHEEIATNTVNLVGIHHHRLQGEEHLYTNIIRSVNACWKVKKLESGDSKVLMMEALTKGVEDVLLKRNPYYMASPLAEDVFHLALYIWEKRRVGKIRGLKMRNMF